MLRMHTYEVELKSLLGEDKNAEALKKRLTELDPASRKVGESSQLNHYFHQGDLRRLYEAVSPLLGEADAKKMANIVEDAREFSVRTRQLNDQVLFIVKASVDSTTSENGIARIELEIPVLDLTLEDLDAKVQGASFAYQAKWSRDREEYAFRDITVTVDRNAGYGYLAELEKMVTDEKELAEAEAYLRSTLNELGLVELEQDRLERMFAHYNANWPEYYGTSKVFTIE